MFRRAFLAATAATFLMPAALRAQDNSQPDEETEMDTKAMTAGTAPVNGLELYYEIHGNGRPLILLHGGVGAIEMFGPVLPLLAEGRQVIAVDLQAHGRTADIDRPLSYEAMASDIAGLADYLKLDRPDLMGYSLGGGVALRAAIDHGDRFGKVVLVSTPFARQGWHDANLQGMAQMGPAVAEPMKNTPMYQLYSTLAPRPADWPILLTKIGQMMVKDYDWSEEVKAIHNPVMIVVGDYDSVRIAHATRFFELLGGGKADGGWDGSGMTPHRFAVLPGMTHYQIFMSPVMAEAVVPFLSAA